MSHAELYPVKPEIAAATLVTKARYEKMVAEAANNPDAYWAEEAKRLEWMRVPTKIKNTSFTGDVSIKWFEDGKTQRRRTIASTVTSRRAADQVPRSFGKATTPTTSKTHHLSRSFIREGLPAWPMC